jgi:succinate-semialdehyde dehydrogenase/glutarate-semialdehyde dehydrogenase
LGGVIPKEVGAFYPITLLSEVEPGMTAFDEEIFGPVFTVIKARDEANAIELGNQTEFGLGSAVFTSDLEKGESIAKTQLNVGACFVNDFVKSDPRLPFGGIKESGYGRELSIYGIMEFVNVKTIVVKNA